ncbi:ABC transporter substrate-binding protein [Arthrobacter sp. PAMC25284]|uniref:ABC transporter substrate-binding protein n=1 Tax=Arthrobacter sp. PAMC25284 TaxID=2861279 RepID=UPI001C632C7B|nr:ABC transporter substrate-binding protein [Arthrobacter sp. PAMC25284]QYF88910.1 ABC transporter substrate-binding protein [Arthrobacter sp. PAMC25284]
MSHPIDVGSVLGGRYKVIAAVLTSHDQDLVLDGVDQVLNRAVSILVAGPGNADQVARSAREVATGERPGSVQILDLHVSDTSTYLITNHTSAADLLDLVVPPNPPYVEPFFTDTLGSEIFGQPRSSEPETYDGLYDDEDVEAGYIDYGQARPAGAPRPAPVSKPDARPVPARADRPAGVPPKPPASRAEATAGAAGAAGAAAAAAASGAAANGAAKKAPAGSPAGGAAKPQGIEPQGAGTAAQDATAHATAPQPVQNGTARRPESPSTEAAPVSEAAKPKVSLWSAEDYADVDTGEGEQVTQPGHVPATASAAAVPGGLDTEDRAPVNFPASARTAQSSADDEFRDDEGEADEDPREPRSMRWLVGGLLAAVLVVGLVFAVANLGSLFRSTPQSNPVPTSTADTPTPEATQDSASPSATAAPAGPPAIDGVTRLGNFDFAATYDGDLSKTFDGNGASYWSDMEFATDNWGGLASEVPLVVKLKDTSKVSSVTLSQLGASGGSISVFTNSKPSLDGAKQVGSNSFTSPELKIPLQEPVTAQYVIVSIKTLPKLAAPKTRYGFGLRLAEIKVQ